MSIHVVPLKTYVITFVLLMALLGLTVVVAYIDLGELNLAAAMAIAIGKAVLIILFFMHVRYGRRLTWVFAAAGFFWLSFLLVFAMIDYRTRPSVMAEAPARESLVSPPPRTQQAGKRGSQGEF